MQLISLLLLLIQIFFEQLADLLLTLPVGLHERDLLCHLLLLLVYFEAQSTHLSILTLKLPELVAEILYTIGNN